jgi:hypothetical protein
VGVVKSKKPNSKGASYQAGSESVPKIRVYEALATLNRDFEQMLRDLSRLEELRLFPHHWQRKFLKTWRATLEETRSWANLEVVEVLHQREEREWVVSVASGSARSNNLNLPRWSCPPNQGNGPPGDASKAEPFGGDLRPRRPNDAL